MLTAELYLISEGPNGPVKIGWSRNSAARLTALQTGNPRRLRLLAAFEMEKDEAIRAEDFLHSELDVFELRLTGEWFDISEKSILGQMPDFFLSDGFEVLSSRGMGGQ
jgi:hypothetical protein